jgi:hypothetical protein
MTITRWTTRLAIAGAAAAALAGAGCGGGSGRDSATGSDTSDDAKELAFARCMREAGIDFPDPEPSAGGRRTQTIRIPRSIAPQRFQQIEATCRDRSGIVRKAPSAEEQEKFRDDALKFARCMRAHGVDLPDPQVRGGGVIIGRAGAGDASLDPESPAFRRAQAACPSNLAARKMGSAGKAITKSAGRTS